MKCSRCHQDNPSQAKFCLECGTPFTPTHEKGPRAQSYADLQHALSEALEREQATGDILRVIASSPTTVEPVFDAILDSALRLCASPVGNLHLFDGETFRLAAHRGMADGFVEAVRGPHRLGSHTGPARVVAERRPIHILDMMADRAYEERDPIRVKAVELLGTRTAHFVPMLKEGTPIGVLVIWRREVRAYSESQIRLLSTFADQAVIAIENVRLFTELQEKNRALTEAHAQVTETLEQQTATSEILRVIASSPTDLQPVMAAVAENAARLCGANDAMILRVENNMLHPAAVFGGMPSVSVPLSRRSPGGRTVIDQQTLHIHDVAAVAAEYPDSPAAARGVRTFLSTPLLSQGDSIGAIVIRRMEVKPFTDQQIALLQTFADQAVIAIENVRLFNETKEALEQQTATGEILRVIASSPTDLQPVMEAVAENAARVCGATDSAIFRLEGEHLRLVARHGSLRRSLAIGESVPVSRDTVGGRAVRDRRTIHVEDILAAEAEFPVTVSRARQARVHHPDHGWRRRCCARARRWASSSSIGGPSPIPSRPSRSRSSRPSPTRRSSPSRTSACSRSCEARNRELTESLEQQTATGEILRVIASSPTDLQPVLDAVAESAARLCGATDVGHLPPGRGRPAAGGHGTGHCRRP